MLRLLYLSISAASIMSTSALICVSPNMALSSEKTRSAAAEFGVHEPTVRIASAHVRINFSEISVKFACQT